MVAYRMPGAPPQSQVPAPPAVSVCRSCGVVAPAHGTACAVCKKPLSETRAQVPAQSVDTFWVAVRCAFTCNSCKFLAPLDGLDADGAVDCAHCGLRQRFEVPSWTPALEFAHAVGDLAGPQPEGRNPHPTLWIGSENPYAGAGDTHAFERTESGALAVDAAPGHPICRRCRVPVAATVAATGAGAVETRCPTCGDTATYAIADEGRKLCGALLAVVADEHRSDRLRAQVTATQAGVMALRCPACGAPLGVPDSGGIAMCTFCKAAAIVPARVRMRARNETPEPDVWWLLFQGASAKRRSLEAPDEAPAGEKLGGKLFKIGIDDAPIGDAPGVYDAPEVSGIYWPQVAVTAVVGTVAVALGMVIYEVILR